MIAALRGIGGRVRKYPAAVALGVGIVTLLILAVWILPPLLAGEGEAENDVRSTLLQGLAGLVLAGGLYFTARTYQHNRESAARTYELDREGQITERFTRAIDQLAEERPDVRLGGIYALERIARESENDHGPIMEVLTAYVRERAPWPPPVADTAEDDVVTDDDGPREDGRPSTDVQAVIAVLGRRELGRKEHDLDLSGVDLRKARFGKGPDEGHFERALFAGAHLERASLYSAHLEEADLYEAHLEGASLQQAHLEGAYLDGAHFEGAYLNGAHLEGAILDEAHLEGAELIAAHLKGAQVKGAHLEGANLQGAIGMTRTQLRSAVLDEDTVLPTLAEDGNES